jgi:biotin carboxylase
LFFRDKFLQKRALPPVLPRARCMYATGYLAFADLAGLLGEPFVVKPANGYGSARTSVISSAEELAGYWAQGADRSDVQFVAESFVPGEEVHVDGVWQHGELVWSCLSRYAEAPADWSQGGVVASGQVARASQPKLYQQIEELARTALAALEAPATVFHLEAFMRADGEPVFGECAIRVAGAMVPEVIDLTYGVDLYDAALSLALGEKPDLGDARSPHRYFGYILLRRFPGVDLTEDDFRAAFDLHDISFGSDARVGSYGRIGHAVVGHADSDELHRLMVDVIAFNRTGLPPRRPRRRAGGSDDA